MSSGTCGQNTTGDMRTDSGKAKHAGDVLGLQ